MAETDAEMSVDEWLQVVETFLLAGAGVDEAIVTRLFTLARRGAAAGDLLEALKVLTANVEHAWPSLSHLGPLVNARAAIARFEALTTQEKDKDNG